MKILIVSPTFYPDVNGASYFTQRLARHLHKKGHSVLVIAPSRFLRDENYDLNGVSVFGIRSFPTFINGFRIAQPVFIKSLIRKKIKEFSPDVIHLQSHLIFSKAVVEIAKGLRIPVIGTNHFMPENLVHYFHLPKIAEKWLRELGWKQCIKALEQLDFVTTPTKTAAELLKKAGFSKKVAPVSCGIDMERFNPINNGLYLKERYAIPADRPVLLYVGRLDKEKKIEVILRSLPKILHAGNIHLVLAGIGKEKKKLETLSEKLNIKKSVTFTGFIPDKDLQNIYRTADIFVIAGIAELQSLVTMEAMASGLPVVAVNAMALPELVRDGENGYLFPAGDSQALAQKIIAIVSDKNLGFQMSQNSLEIIKTHDINRTIEKYEALYNKIINH